MTLALTSLLAQNTVASWMAGVEASTEKVARQYLQGASLNQIVACTVDLPWNDKS